MARIGLRNLKTALAVFICMVISKLLKLEYPFFVAVAALISMENSLMHSFKAGKSRMLGTVIGAAIGLLCALIRPGSAILCGLGMIGVIYCCNLLQWRKPIQIAGVVFMAIMVGLKGATPLQYSINRVIDTFIGILVAMIVNYLVFPPDYLPRIRHSVTELLITTEQIIHQLLIFQRTTDLTEYEKEFAKANQLLELYCNDQKIRHRDDGAATPHLQKIFLALNQIGHHLQIVSQMHPLPNLNEANTRDLRNIFNWRDLPRQDYREDETGIIFNYLFAKILSLYQSVKQAEEAANPK